MKILLTNDDGFGAQGLEALIAAFSVHHDVWVVAPDQDRSGVSHGFTMNVPLCIKTQASQQFACSGLPADCTDVGIKKIVTGKPDVVVSGINKGANLGTDIVYSGTAAAARHACMHGIPGIAVSLSSDGHWDYIPLASFVANNIEQLIQLHEKDVFININASDKDILKGCKYTIPARRNYQDVPEFFTAPNGHTYSFFNGAPVQTDLIEGTDYTAVHNGYISISRVLAQPCTVNEKNDLPITSFMI